jgi:N utilization substance protein A
VTEQVARSMYRAGFRMVEELADASDAELAGIPGVGGVEAAQQLKRDAEKTLDVIRSERLEKAKTNPEPLEPRARLLLAKGIGERTATLLEEAGYKTLEDITREDDDKLAQKAGLPLAKAKAVKQSATAFLTGEWKTIEEARKRLPPPAAAQPEQPKA